MGADNDRALHSAVSARITFLVRGGRTWHHRSAAAALLAAACHVRQRLACVR